MYTNYGISLFIIAKKLYGIDFIDLSIYPL